MRANIKLEVVKCRLEHKSEYREKKIVRQYVGKQKEKRNIDCMKRRKVKEWWSLSRDIPNNKCEVHYWPRVCIYVYKHT